jgi:hypothetical protein
MNGFDIGRTSGLAAGQAPQVSEHEKLLREVDVLARTLDVPTIFEHIGRRFYEIEISSDAARPKTAPQPVVTTPLR